jgi:hypothetical protein
MSTPCGALTLDDVFDDITLSELTADVQLAGPKSLR